MKRKSFFKSLVGLAVAPAIPKVAKTVENKPEEILVTVTELLPSKDGMFTKFRYESQAFPLIGSFLVDSTGRKLVVTFNGGMKRMDRKDEPAFRYLMVYHQRGPYAEIKVGDTFKFLPQ